MKLFMPIIAMFILLACANNSVQPTFYSLNATPLIQKDFKTNLLNDDVIYLHKVKVSEYLNDPRMIMQSGKNQLTTLSLQRWAAPLSDELTTLTLNQLEMVLPNTKILTGQPVKKNMINLYIEVERFHLIVPSKIIVSGRLKTIGLNQEIFIKAFSEQTEFNGSYDDAVSQLRKIWLKQISAFYSDN